MLTYSPVEDEILKPPEANFIAGDTRSDQDNLNKEKIMEKLLKAS